MNACVEWRLLQYRAGVDPAFGGEGLTGEFDALGQAVREVGEDDHHPELQRGRLPQVKVFEALELLRLRSIMGRPPSPRN